MPDSRRDSGDNDLSHGVSAMARMVAEALRESIINFGLRFGTGGKRSRSDCKRAWLACHEWPVRLTGRVILVSGRLADKPLDFRDAVEGIMGGRSGSRNDRGCGRVIKRDSSR